MLMERIKKERIQAMKDGETLKKNLLSTLIGDACKEVKEPDDASVMATIRKFIKGCDEISTVVECGSPDYQKCEAEKEILLDYLPNQMTEKEIILSIGVAKSVGCSDMGSIMKFFTLNLTGKYDGKLVSKLVKESL